MTKRFSFDYVAAMVLSALIPSVAAGDDGLRRVLPPQHQFGDWRFVTITEGAAPHSIVAFRNVRQATADTVVWIQYQEEASRWTSKAWPGASPALVLTAIKQSLGLGDDSDGTWPIAPADSPSRRIRPGSPQAGSAGPGRPPGFEFPRLDPLWVQAGPIPLETDCDYHEVLTAMTVEARWLAADADVSAPVILIESRALRFCEYDLIGATPTVEVVPIGDAVRVSHTGKRYFLSGDDVRFAAMANDPEDGDLPSAMVLNDLPYIPGSPITEVGDHFLKAAVIDSDGNLHTDCFRFSIQAYEPTPSVIEIITVEEDSGDPNGQTLSLTAAIRSSAFNVREIDVCTIRLMIPDQEDGNGSRHHVYGSWDGSGRVQTPGNADAGIVAEEFICSFRGIPATAALDALEIIGGGVGFPDSFLFWGDAPIVLRLEDPRVKNPPEAVEIEVSPPSCGLVSTRKENSIFNLRDRLESDDEHHLPQCSRSWELYHMSSGDQLLIATARQVHDGFEMDPLILDSQGGHGATHVWTAFNCPQDLDECPLVFELYAKPRFTLQCEADAAWHYPAGFAAARAAGAMEVRLQGAGGGCTAGAHGGLAIHDGGQTTVGGSIGAGGIGVSITFNPAGVTKETIDIEAMPCSTSVVSHSLSASIEVACWNHVRTVASTRCPFALLKATAVSNARVTNWDPNYRLEATRDDSSCSPEPGPLLPY